MASFAWWTARFAEAGLVRCDATERRIAPELARMGMTKYWNLYVLRHRSAPEPGDGIRSPDAVEEMLARLGLVDRIADPVDLAAVRDALGRRPTADGSPADAGELTGRCRRVDRAEAGGSPADADGLTGSTQTGRPPTPAG